jgi:adenylate cyclase
MPTGRMSHGSPQMLKRARNHLRMPAATTRQESETRASLRLDSWKEIANYLKRGVRTVRRWERQERLPVHRHVHSKQATVYAFAHEIDVWLKSRSPHVGAVQLLAHDSQQPREMPALRMAEKDGRNRPVVVAILPLRSVSGDPDQERFADGLTEELILEAGQCCSDQLRIIAFTSVIQYKQSAKNIRQIGQELGADYILEGSIRRYGRRVRLTARLIATRDQAHIWADSYEIQLPPIFALQQALARQVTDSLAARLSSKPARRRLRTPSPSIAAHSAYIEGRSHYMATEGESKKCIEKLNLAIEKDPHFAPSYAELALAYFRRLFSDYPPIVTLRRIEEMSAKALKLDSKLARGHAMLAAFQLFGARNWRKADTSSREALKLNPSDAWAEVVRVAYDVVICKVPEAIEDLNRAEQLDPKCTERGIWFAILAYLARSYDRAIELCQEILRRDSALALAHRVLGSCYAQAGDYSLAVSHCEKARELGDGSASGITAACSVYALAGERDAAEHLFRGLVAAQEQHYIRYIFLARAAASLGKNQQALDWLEKSYEQHDPLLVFLKVDPRFDPLSELAPFRKLLRRLRLPS